VKKVREFISQQQHSIFSYSDVGASADHLPEGYKVDRYRILLGSGESIWHRAVEAVRGWQMFNIPWVRLYWPTSPIQVGVDVAILIEHLGFCSLNASRIVYVVNDDGPIIRYGFAYGTLAQHAERGEERFTVEWDRSENKVWYDILAFSRPNQTLAKVGYRWTRTLQRRFGEASKTAMLQATCSGK